MTTFQILSNGRVFLHRTFEPRESCVGILADPDLKQVIWRMSKTAAARHYGCSRSYIGDLRRKHPRPT